MAFFPTPPPPLEAVIRAQAAGQHVFAALFVTFAFKTGALRVWEGDGPIKRGGVDWVGMGQRVDGSGSPLQSIDGLEQAANGTAPRLSLTLNGVDSTVVTAAKSTVPDEIEGRDRNGNRKSLPNLLTVNDNEGSEDEESIVIRL